ncbi:MAG: AAA family ATPase, partial [Acidobacteria bacterium]|nr:AAA family ATPase [Acidobacteriota bacterium]
VMLYEILTGRLPYSGPVMKILTDKQKIDPPPPSTLNPRVPEDLDVLCVDLLHRDPRSRPKGREVLRRLGAGDQLPLIGSSSMAPPFVGRDRHLKTLQGAFDDSCAGRTIALFVHGSSGMGKSALVHRFLDDLHLRDEEVVVLAGRCFQRESVPYKAFDSLIDSLSRYLRALPRQEVETMLPYNVLALARLFPVLLRVKAVAESRRRVLEIPDSGELRRRAFSALRELLLRLSDRHPLVLFIDDLQWGDLDSAALIQELLRPPDPPPMLLIACFRSEEVLTSPLLRSVFSHDLTRSATEVRELAVRELDSAEARTLARRLLGVETPGESERTPEVERRLAHGDTLAETVARESGGNPFFVDALVRYAQTLSSGGDPSFAELERVVASATVEKAVQARIERLAPEARRLLAVVTVAGRPLLLEVAARAALIEEELQPALAGLRALQLVRMRGARGGEELEPYHDRIRQVVLEGLSPDRLIAYHRSLARALQETGHGDPETLAHHYRAAQDREPAAHFAVLAADRAAEALAFDRAARLYRQATEMVTQREALPELRVKLGDALANSGRGADAAQVYLAAADDAPEPLALELRRRAAEQLLSSGRIDKGLATVRHVLRTVGMEMPATQRQAVLSLLWRRLQLRIRGLRFRSRLEEEVSPEDRLRIDTCWAVSVGLGLVDPLRGRDFGTRALLLALRHGDLYRVARSLAIEAGYSATRGNRAHRHTEHLIRLSGRLAQEVQRPHALGLAALTAGIAYYLQGQWSIALERLESAEETLRERCTGVTWELDTAVLFQLRCLLFLGRFGTIALRIPQLMREIQERGDLYAETNVRSRVTWAAWLARDEVELARTEVEASLDRWSQQGFHLQHYWHMIGTVEVALYGGARVGAWKRLQNRWPELERSLLLRIQLTRLEAWHLRARTALAAAVQLGPEAGETPSLRRAVRKAIRRMRREGSSWGLALAGLVEAGLESLQGRRRKVLALLESAAEGLEGREMTLYAAAARRRLGQLIGGPQGAEQILEADARLREAGIENPEAMADLLAPGEWPRPV